MRGEAGHFEGVDLGENEAAYLVDDHDCGRRECDVY